MALSQTDAQRRESLSAMRRALAASSSELATLELKAANLVAIARGSIVPLFPWTNRLSERRDRRANDRREQERGERAL